MHARESPTAGTGTPYLVFSTCPGGSKPCEFCTNALTFVQKAASDTGGNISVTGGTTVSDLSALKTCQLKPSKDSTGSGPIAYTVAASISPIVRTGKTVVTVNKKSKAYTVRQAK